MSKDNINQNLIVGKTTPLWNFYRNSSNSVYYSYQNNINSYYAPSSKGTSSISIFLSDPEDSDNRLREPDRITDLYGKSDEDFVSIISQAKTSGFETLVNETSVFKTNIIAAYSPSSLNSLFKLSLTPPLQPVSVVQNMTNLSDIVDVIRPYMFGVSLGYKDYTPNLHQHYTKTGTFLLDFKDNLIENRNLVAAAFGIVLEANKGEVTKTYVDDATYLCSIIEGFSQIENKVDNIKNEQFRTVSETNWKNFKNTLIAIAAQYEKKGVPNQSKRSSIPKPQQQAKGAVTLNGEPNAEESSPNVIDKKGIALNTFTQPDKSDILSILDILRDESTTPWTRKGEKIKVTKSSNASTVTGGGDCVADILKQLTPAQLNSIISSINAIQTDYQKTLAQLNIRRNKIVKSDGFTLASAINGIGGAFSSIVTPPVELADQTIKGIGRNFEAIGVEAWSSIVAAKDLSINGKNSLLVSLNNLNISITPPQPLDMEAIKKKLTPNLVEACKNFNSIAEMTQKGTLINTSNKINKTAKPAAETASNIQSSLDDLTSKNEQLTTLKNSVMQIINTKITG